MVVTLGRYSMATFMPGARIGQVHGTSAPADPATGARDALVFAMYHPAAALRTAAIERESFEDVARVPQVLVRARERREGHQRPPPRVATATVVPAPSPPPAVPVAAPADAAASLVEPAADDASQLTLF